MKIIRDIGGIPADLRCAVTTIGNFDGVHLGHRFIFGKLVEEAGRESCPAVVITFEPHPKLILHPERRPFHLITSLEEKLRLIAETGVDYLLVIPFTLEYARTTAEEFVRGLLWERLRTRKILIGHDYTFGRGKEGDKAFLSEAGRRLGFAVEVMDAFQVGGTTVSSTRIRLALLAGEVRFAAGLLGRHYNLGGRIISGSRRGADLGFPTANIRPGKELVPARGVYAVHVLLDGERRQGVLNIGFNPTFAAGSLSVEVHILDFNDNIYGREIEILFVERLRDEVRFEGPEQLAAQIGRDIAKARKILHLR